MNNKVFYFVPEESFEDSFFEMLETNTAAPADTVEQQTAWSLQSCPAGKVYRITIEEVER